MQSGTSNLYDYIEEKGYGVPIKTLGEGAYGFVNLHRTEYGDEYAVKISQTKKSDQTSEISQTNKSDQTLEISEYLYEINCFQRCNHKNVIKMYDHFIYTEDDIIYYILILEAGDMNLDTAIETNSIRDLKYCAYQIICGLQHMLNNGIMSSDLKPKNIIYFKNEDRIAISDFGLAQLNICSDKKYGIRSEAYTYWYKSPEVFLKSSNYNEKSEAWALGITLYELFNSGNIPTEIGELFDEDIMTPIMDISQLYKTDKNIYDVWPDYYQPLHEFKDPELDHLIKNLLKLNPNERISIFQALEEPYFSSYHLEERETPLTCLQSLKKYEISYEMNEKFEEQWIDFITVNYSTLLKVRFPEILMMTLQLFRRIVDNMKYMNKIDFTIIIATCDYIAACYPFEEIMDYRSIYTNMIDFEGFLTLFDIFINKLNGYIFCTIPTDYINLYSNQYDRVVYNRAKYIATYLYFTNLPFYFDEYSIAIRAYAEACKESNFHFDVNKFTDRDIDAVDKLMQFDIHALGEYLGINYKDFMAQIPSQFKSFSSIA